MPGNILQPKGLMDLDLAVVSKRKFYDSLTEGKLRMFPKIRGHHLKNGLRNHSISTSGKDIKEELG